MSASDQSGLGRYIGPYELTAVLGRGGMGIVYRATQHEPLVREVALKTVEVGLDSGIILSRFEIERQVLARMSHPSIARVYDAGLSDEGQPFFAMELVEGTSLTEYCDGRRLLVRDRLRLFGQVCHAVHHAHHKGDHSPRPEADQCARDRGGRCAALQGDRLGDRTRHGRHRHGAGASHAK